MNPNAISAKPIVTLWRIAKGLTYSVASASFSLGVFSGFWGGLKGTPLQDEASRTYHLFGGLIDTASSIVAQEMGSQSLITAGAELVRPLAKIACGLPAAGGAFCGNLVVKTIGAVLTKMTVG